MVDTQPSAGAQTVLVVGGTGDLGGRVVDALLARHKRVRALVREGTDASRLTAKGVEIVRGDMLDPPSLDRAMEGVSAVVTSAAGYTRRRRGDSLRTDDVGNKNLVGAAKRAGVGRFVFTSILTCDLARDVPHFWTKKVIEDYLEASGVPFVSLRPGAFLGGGGGGFWARMLKQRKVFRMTPPGVRITFIHPDEVARALAMAVDEPRAVGRRIDLGSDRALSSEELAGVLSSVLGAPVRVGGGGGMMAMFRFIAIFSKGARDLFAMFRFFATGKYVADTAIQGELFGPVPKVEEAARRLVAEAGVQTKVP